jgi:hypothetical protein
MFSTSAALRAQALAIVAVLQVGVVAAASAPEKPKPRPNAVELARSFAERPLSEVLLAPPAPSILVPSPAPRSIVRQTPRPAAPKPAAPAAAAPAPGARYVPRGTGMWLYQWEETEGGDARAIVHRAQVTGLSHLYVRTGTRKGGFDAARQLRALLPATKGTNIQVIAWDFPQLKNPLADARRLAAAANFRVPGAPRIMAVAPDIETGAEGTKLTGHAVDTYLKTLRRLLPNDVSIIGVVPWPSEKRLGRYPFDVVAKWSDAVAPMAYWVNRDPATVVRQSMQRLGRYRKPVLPIGQAYDPRIDVPTLKWGPPSRAQMDAFFRTADAQGAESVSLWVWQFASPDQWKALAAARSRYSD